MVIKTMIADDHRLFIEGLTAILRKHDEIAVVGEATDGNVAVSNALALMPDILLMDISMPGINGIEATRKIVADAPGISIIVLSMHTDREFVLEALKAGAKGFVVKSSASAELVSAIHAVAAGQMYVSPDISGLLVKELFFHEKKEKPGLLSPREIDVLRGLAEGNTTKQVAYMLQISSKTVETYRKRLMEKLGIKNLVELTKYALQEGIISL